MLRVLTIALGTKGGLTMELPILAAENKKAMSRLGSNAAMNVYPLRSKIALN